MIIVLVDQCCLHADMCIVTNKFSVSGISIEFDVAGAERPWKHRTCSDGLDR